MESACSFRPMELFTKANFLKICRTAVGVCGSIQGPHILVTVYLLAHLVMHPDVSTLDQVLYKRTRNKIVFAGVNLKYPYK